MKSQGDKAADKQFRMEYDISDKQPQNVPPVSTLVVRRGPLDTRGGGVDIPFFYIQDEIIYLFLFSMR